MDDEEDDCGDGGLICFSVWEPGDIGETTLIVLHPFVGEEVSGPPNVCRLSEFCCGEKDGRAGAELLKTDFLLKLVRG